MTNNLSSLKSKYLVKEPKPVLKRRDWPLFWFKTAFLLPAFAFLMFYMFYPIIENFRIAMTRSTGLGKETYIGWLNYIRLFSDEDFLRALYNGFKWAFWSVVIQIPLAFFIAYACVILKTKFILWMRGVYYLSNVLPAAIISLFGLFLFSPHFGAICLFFNTIGLPAIGKLDFLGDPDLSFWTLFSLATWAYIGFGIIYLMATIEQIPAELGEAARIDGANRWQYAWYIVLPETSYALRIQAILCTVGSLKLFDIPQLVTRGGPGKANMTLSILLYNEGFVNWQYGKAAAVGVVIFLLSLIFTVVQFSMQRKDTN